MVTPKEIVPEGTMNNSTKVILKSLREKKLAFLKVYTYESRKGAWNLIDETYMNFIDELYIKDTKLHF